MPSSPPSPCFLSIIIRTMGTRPELLDDALKSLLAQTCDDFEIVLVHHRPNGGVCPHPADDAPAALVGKIVSVVSSRPGRSSPLNDGLAAARGRYVAFLDDDDFALPHWVETFRDMARSAPGAIVRTRCYRQKWRMDRSGGARVAVARGPRELGWAETYDLDAHLLRNETPFMCFAFPRSVFSEEALTFDESLSTLEDWDVATRAALKGVVVSNPAATAVYRWWIEGESSSFLHSSAERRADDARVAEKFAVALQLSTDAFELRRRAIADDLRRRRRRLSARAGRLLSTIARGMRRIAWAAGLARD